MEISTHRSKIGHDSTSVFPSEVLAAIIDVACKTYTDRSVGWLVALGAVCSRWRAVMWSHPQIWTDFRCDQLCSNVGVLDILDLHLKNAGSLALSVSLHGHPNSYVWFPLLRALFSTNSDRIRSLEFHNLDPESQLAITEYSRHSEFPRLEAINFFGYGGTGWYSISDRVYSVDFPRLRSLKIRKTLRFNVCCFISLQTITELSLEDIHHKQALYILSKCPNLTDGFAFDAVATTPTYLGPTSSSDIVIPGLTSFKWHSEGYEYTCDGIHLQLPAVRHIRFSLERTTEISPGWMDVWRSMFLRTKHLETLEIGSDAIGLVPEVLALLPGQKLRRIGIRVYELAELRKCLEHLSYGSGGECSPFFQLEDIDIGFGSKIIKHQHILELIDAVVALVRSRRLPILPSCCVPLCRLQLSGKLFIKSLLSVVDYEGVSRHLKSFMLPDIERLELDASDMDMIISEDGIRCTRGIMNII